MAEAALLPKPEKRKPLTRVQFATLILKQEGKCGCSCGKKLQADRIIDEHVVALDFLGSNDLTNRSLWDKDCSKAKTARDLAAAAKGKRIRGETGNGVKRKIANRPFPDLSRKAPALGEEFERDRRDGSKILSAGFRRSATLVRGVDGKVRERK
jgi:hypothetical protein